MEKAKRTATDTILSNDFLDKVNGHWTLRSICEVQAETSFKAGLAEVVSWLEINCACFDPDSNAKFMGDWHKQLKEWGINGKGKES